MSVNPYASPAVVDEEPIVVSDEELSLSERAKKAFLRWSLICCVSAAPSFFWGVMLHSKGYHVGAMLAGILVWVLVYTGVECSDFYLRMKKRPHVGGTLRFGYGTRIFTSIVFPIGIYLDCLVGMVSTQATEKVYFYLLGQFSDFDRESFGAVFLTTLIQGLLLNVLLGVYMLVIYGLIVVFSSATKSLPPLQPSTGR